MPHISFKIKAESISTFGTMGKKNIGPCNRLREVLLALQATRT